MAMTSVSVMMTVFVLNLHYRGPKKNEIPFWLQQVLSLSLANTVRTLRREKKLKITYKKSQDVTSKKPTTPTYPTINGLLLSYMNINETTKNKLRTPTTTDVSKFFI